MQLNIHPQSTMVSVLCNCGNAFGIKSTIEKTEMHIELCSSCHPFYTGQQKVVDTAGTIQKFHNRFAQRGKKKI